MNRDRPRETLGVLGGLGPAAGAQFLVELAAASPATTDQGHPRVVMLSEPSVPDRSAAILAGSNAPALALEDGLRTLVEWGADLLAVPCNSAHVFLHRLTPELPAPLIDIVESTVSMAASESPRGAWLAATDGVVASRLYSECAVTRGYPLHIPDQKVQHAVRTSIRWTKAGDHEAAAAAITEAWSLLGDHDLPVIGACTEIPLAWHWAQLPADRLVSSTVALARACVRRLYGAS